MSNPRGDLLPRLAMVETAPTQHHGDERRSATE
jgi:hypothetical protein